MSMVGVLASLRSRLLLAIVGALLLSACGTSVPGTGPAPQGNGSANSRAAPGPQASEAKQIAKATLALGIDNLSVASLVVAQEKGYFREEGVDLELVSVEGSGPAIQALTAGSVQFAVSGSGGLTGPATKGVTNVIAIELTTSRLTMDLVLSKKALAKTGLTPASPIDQKLKALKGMMLGATSAGAPTDVYTQYYLNQAGLHANQETKITYVGSGASLQAALRNDLIDGFMLTPPDPQMAAAKGGGTIFITGAEVPGLNNFAYVMISTQKGYADKNPEVPRAVARGLARGNNLILDDPDQALTILQQHFNKVEPEILKASLQSVQSAVPRDGKMTQLQWETAIQLDKLSGLVKAELDATEGVLWTNAYVKDVQGKSN